MALKHRVAMLAARSIASVFPKRLAYSPRFFEVWESKGYHILPVHYESPIPPPLEIKNSLWSKPSQMVASDMRDAEQLNLLDTFRKLYKSEYDAFPRQPGGGEGFHLNNGWYEKVDAEIWYSVIRYFRPGAIIEIGSGLSTTLAAQAVRKNQTEYPGYDCEFFAIEPRPVRLNPSVLPPNFKLLQKNVQDVDLGAFSVLKENDILFIDSSHVCRTGSDVNYEILEILPRLNRGVLIHFHDIFLPWEYPECWVRNHRFLSEQYMLQAFLTCNRDFEVVWGSYHMLRSHPDALDNAFATFRIDITPPGTFLPGSFWIRKTA